MFFVDAVNRLKCDWSFVLCLCLIEWFCKEFFDFFDVFGNSLADLLDISVLLVNLLLCLFVLNREPRLQDVHHVLDLLDALIHFVVEIHRVLSDCLTNRVKRALPLTVTLSVVGACHDGQELRFVFLLPLVLVFPNVLDVVWKNTDFHLTAVLFVTLSHLSERVTHDGNNHI